MARIRTIKPELPQSESMGRVSRDARLCFLMLLTLADDAGRLRGSSRMLASLLFPYDDDAAGLMDEWLTALEVEACITRYHAEGNTYIQINNWLKHQKIDKPSASKIPAPLEHSRTLANVLEHSSEDQGSRIKEEIKEEIKDRGTKSFDEFFEACPKKVGRAEAEQQYELALAKTDAATLLKAMQQYAKSRNGQDPTFTKSPANWLSAERWQDYAPSVVETIKPEALAKLRAQWGGAAGEIIDDIGIVNFKTWLERCALLDGPPKKLIADSTYKAGVIDKRFGAQLRKRLGEDLTIEAAA